MKVQVTFELTPDERIAIGVAQSGTFVPANREQAKKYLNEAAGLELRVLVDRVKQARKLIVKDIKESLDG